MNREEQIEALARLACKVENGDDETAWDDEEPIGWPNGDSARAWYRDRAKYLLDDPLVSRMIADAEQAKVEQVRAEWAGAIARSWSDGVVTSLGGLDVVPYSALAEVEDQARLRASRTTHATSGDVETIREDLSQWGAESSAVYVAAYIQSALTDAEQAAERRGAVKACEVLADPSNMPWSVQAFATRPDRTEIGAYISGYGKRIESGEDL